MGLAAGDGRLNHDCMLANGLLKAFSSLSKVEVMPMSTSPSFVRSALGRVVSALAPSTGTLTGCITVEWCLRGGGRGEKDALAVPALSVGGEMVGQAGAKPVEAVLLLLVAVMVVAPVSADVVVGLLLPCEVLPP